MLERPEDDDVERRGRIANDRLYQPSPAQVAKAERDAAQAEEERRRRILLAAENSSEEEWMRARAGEPVWAASVRRAHMFGLRAPTPQDKR